MFKPTRRTSRGPVLLPGTPVNWSHRLNHGRLLWLLSVPKWLGGATWYDLCGHYNGTMGGSARLAGANRNADAGWGEVSLNGSTDNVSLGGSLLGNAAFPVTIAAWVCPTAVTGDQTILARWSNNPSLQGFLFELTGSSLLWAGRDNFAGTYMVGSTASSAVSAGAWQRVGVVWDGSLTATGYVNGVAYSLSFSLNQGLNNLGAGSASNCLVGSDAADDGKYLGGGIDDVTVWSRALSAAEMVQDYRLGLAGYPGLLNRIATLDYPTASPPPPPPPSTMQMLTLLGCGS